ncbi:response regulator [Roseomonas fluvialis]|uniref:Response regulator n=1 Tax=Roseomonas fluvialis TaxID=1750527 RepID=A0ABN6P494_9PROT|nr:response regulator [Roseomonas fluvialis]BDG73492.1 response regulator [Roseomonas fluvialis]
MKPLRILVVEDNAVIGMLLSLTLKAMGHEVCAVETTEDGAVATALRCSPDLLIVDMTLGHGSGASAVATILQTRHIPHILMSGAPVQADGQRRVVLRKPFVEAELAQAIERAVRASTGA